MSNILAIKTELKEKMNINDEQLGELFKSTMFSLMAKVKEIGGTDFITSIMNMDYDKMVKYDPDDFKSVDAIQREENIDDVNIGNKDEKKNFKCLCGKPHLHKLNLFDHKNCDKKLVIGSTCIGQVEKLKEVYHENTELCNKLDTIISCCATSERLITHKPCFKCGDLVIKKDYPYVKPHMMNYCRECLVGKDKDEIHCGICKYKKIPASQPLNKKTRDKFKDKCPSCWYAQNKHQPWMRNNRN